MARTPEHCTLCDVPDFTASSVVVTADHEYKRYNKKSRASNVIHLHVAVHHMKSVHRAHRLTQRDSAVQAVDSGLRHAAAK